MSPVRVTISSCVLIVLLITACCRPAISQLVELRNKNSKEFGCARSGLFGFGSACGTQYYDEVFVGTVLSIKHISEWEMDLTLRPEEVFKGSPGVTLEVKTSQGICFPDFLVGNQWLFYLQKDEKSGDLTVAYRSPSGPIADEQENVSRLRRLSKFQDSGLIIGQISARDEDHYVEPRANHRVVIRRLDNNAEYTVYTSKDGEYEFPPLRAGSYDLDLNTEPGLWTEWTGKMTVEANQCMNYSAELQIDGTISGNVWTADGKPVDAAQVEAIWEHGFSSSFTDSSGHFVIRGLEPGRYVVGLHISDGDRGKASVYAPGVRDQSKASVIDLGRAEKREHVNIRIPPEPSK